MIYLEGEKDDLSDYLELGQKIPLKGDYLKEMKAQVLKLHDAKKNKKDNA